MCVRSNFTLFKEFQSLEILKVSLPNNGVNVLTLHIGIIHLSPILTLHGVLHVLSFHLNMISVSSLVKTSIAYAHFCHGSYIIKELTQIPMIKKCKIFHNLYVFTTNDLPSSVNYMSFFHPLLLTEIYGINASVSSQVKTKKLSILHVIF